MRAESPEKAKGGFGGDMGVPAVLDDGAMLRWAVKSQDSFKCPYKHNWVIFCASHPKYPFWSKASIQLTKP